MNSTMIIRCPHCAEKMSVPSDYAGLESKCPKCRREFVMSAEPAPSAPAPRVSGAQASSNPHPVAASHPAVKSQNMRVTGWICFSGGMVLLVLCPIIPFYSPFFLVSFVLAVVLLVRDEGRGGLALLLTTLLVPTAVGGVIFMLGVGAMMAALTGFAKEAESNQKALVAQQQAVLNQVFGQQQTLARSATPQAAPPRPMFFQPPSTPAQQPPVARPLPAREVSYDGFLKILNKYGDDYNRAQTTVQKKDVRARAQKEVVVFVENARMTLEGKVRDVQFGNDGKADLLFSDFAAPGSAVQANRNLSAYSFGKLPVPITREEALAIKPGQKVRITGRPFVVANDSLVATMFDEAVNPSLITFRFILDIETLVTLRMRDYTVNFEDKQVQAAPRVKKPYSLIVVPPKANP